MSLTVRMQKKVHRAGLSPAPACHTHTGSGGLAMGCSAVWQRNVCVKKRVHILQGGLISGGNGERPCRRSLPRSLCKELSSNFPGSVWQPHTNFDSFNFCLSFLFEKLSAANKGCTLPDFHAGNGHCWGLIKANPRLSNVQIVSVDFIEVTSLSIKLICSSKTLFWLCVWYSGKAAHLHASAEKGRGLDLCEKGKETWIFNRAY